MRVKLVVLAAVLASGFSIAACNSEGPPADTNQSNAGALGRATFENIGVAVSGPFQTIAEINPNTCPHRPAHNGATGDQFYVPDGPARAYVDQQGRTRLIFPHFLNYAFVGSSIESAALDCNDVISESTQDPDSSHLDDTSWLWATYKLNDGRVAGYFHMEYHAFSFPQLGLCAGPSYFNPECPWYSAITFGIANDGIHFTRPASPAHVVAGTGVASYPKRSLGYSDHSSIMKNPRDGRYYMTAMARGMDDPGSIPNCILRTADVADAKSWETWNGAGWVNAASGPHCKSVISAEGNAPGSLLYNKFLDRNILLNFADVPGQGQGFFMYVALNDELTQWSAPIKVVNAALPWGNNPSIKGAALHAYPSFLPMVPTASGNFDEIGEEGYLFFIRTKGLDGSQQREVVRTKVTFRKGTGEIVTDVGPGKGFYRAFGGGHYANGDGAYCAISSMDQLTKCGWTAPFNELPEYASHSISTYQGVCQCGLAAGTVPGAVDPGDGKISRGCYRIASGGYFSNGTGQSCGLLGPNLGETCGTGDFNALQPRADHGGNVLQSACILPQGCYRIGPAGFFADANGRSCSLLGDWLQDICGTTDFTKLKDLPTHGGNAQDGACRTVSTPAPPTPPTPPTPTPPTPPPPPSKLGLGCYRIGGGGYFSNGGGQSCGLLGPNLPATCGTGDFNALQPRADHGGNVLQSACILPQGCYRIGGGGHYSNGQGQSCSLLGAWLQEICGTTDFYALKDLPSAGGDADNGSCR